MNVYERTQQRLKTVFDLFDNIYVSFSGGKDSGVLLNLCIDYVRRHGLRRRIGVFHMDYEIQYRDTLDYVDRTLAANADILDVYRVCVPFKVQTCTSMFRQYWRPWEESKRDVWVREMPEGCLTHQDFPFFTDEMWDYEFQNRFAEWLHARSGATRTCCLIGIRTQESFNRWRTIYSDRNHHRFAGKRWIRQWAGGGICNAYPLYDWLTTDIWTANGRFGWPYNRLYDLFYRAGVPLDSQRVASPFISPAIASLHLYKAVDPDTWGRMVGRVDGANFAALYGRTAAVGWQSARLPKGMTWERYMHFLLSTLPEPTRRNYLEKLSVSIRFWREKGRMSLRGNHRQTAQGRHPHRSRRQERLPHRQASGAHGVSRRHRPSGIRSAAHVQTHLHLYSEKRPRLQIHGFFAQQERNAAPQENHGKI